MEPLTIESRREISVYAQVLNFKKGKCESVTDVTPDSNVVLA